MFAQSPFVSQFISSRSKLSFKNCWQQQQQCHFSEAFIKSYQYKSILENCFFFFFFLHTPMRMLVRLCDTWGLFNKTSSSSNITLKPEAGCTSVHIQVQYYPTASQIPVSGEGQGQGQGQAAASWLVLKPSLFSFSHFSFSKMESRAKQQFGRNEN